MLWSQSSFCKAEKKQEKLKIIFSRLQLLEEKSYGVYPYGQMAIKY